MRTDARTRKIRTGAKSQGLALQATLGALWDTTAALIELGPLTEAEARDVVDTLASLRLAQKHTATAISRLARIAGGA